MRNRKKHMKLPNGFGSIKCLSGNRRKPYAVYPPVTEWTPTSPVTPPALAYTETWEEGYELLTAYNMEKAGKIKINRSVFIERTPTFAEVYQQFFDEKFHNSPKNFSKETIASTRAAYKNCSAIHDIPIGNLRYDDLQQIINNCPLKHSSLELIVSLLHQIYAFAIKYEICEKDYSAFLYIPIPDDDESGEPFTLDELNILWTNKADPIVQMILIMCYSGFRIRAYASIEVHLDEAYFKGGVKTAASKNRIVPIHSCIQDFVAERYDNTKALQNLLGCTPALFRKNMYSTLEKLSISYSASGKKHTPHDCRHTFSYLCEKYNVNENDRKRMMGHSFGNDITNATYGHRSINDLKTEIEKIRFP